MVKPSFLRNFQTQDDRSTHLHDELLSTMDVMLALRMAANNTDIDFSEDMNSDGAVTPVDAPLIWQPMIT